MQRSTPPMAALRVTREDPWTIHEFDTLSSTNVVARTLPAWNAVRATTQTGGYGRTGRSWVSDAGGLWLSAILPTPGPREKWTILPLAVGWAVIEALREMGVTNLRMRWPNDIMVGRRKLAGLLLERFDADSTVVGIGINIANQPDRVSSELRGLTIRLQDLLPGDCSVADVTPRVLNAMARVHRILTREGFAPIANLINLEWDVSRKVELSLNTGFTLRGHFDGIDAEGRLMVQVDGRLAIYAADEVGLLREID